MLGVPWIQAKVVLDCMRPRRVLSKPIPQLPEDLALFNGSRHHAQR